VPICLEMARRGVPLARRCTFLDLFISRGGLPSLRPLSAFRMYSCEEHIKVESALPYNADPDIRHKGPLFLIGHTADTQSESDKCPCQGAK
jgi:hypothetical protein